MIEGSDVVGDLPHVIERNARGLGILIKQQVGERGLRSLNVRGQNRLLSDVRIEVEIQVRETGEAPPKAVNLILDMGQEHRWKLTGSEFDSQQLSGENLHHTQPHVNDETFPLEVIR